MTGIADSLVNVFWVLKMIIIPNSGKAIGRVFLLSYFFLGHGGAQSVAESLDKGELNLAAGIFYEIPVVI